ncbi:flagellar protein MotY [Pleionea sediminis]|uniref:flagellar protein MotY n=1 Tax=Pleionea sediminis TaxID=2569479 RepID=UPI001186F6B1|nr:OmpA family protein [Pleionea sediminis]
MIRRLSALLLTFCVLFSVGAGAEFRTYLADIEQSKWSFSGNPVRCELKHKIPRYGEAVFFARASRTPNMAFVLDSMRNRLKTDRLIGVRAIAPTWRPGKRAVQMDSVSAIPGEKTLNILDDSAWKLLVALEQGMNPAFYYRDFEDKRDRVAIALSAVNFQSVYDNFLTCVESLLRYDFWEIQYTMVNFGFNKSNLTNDDKHKLDVLSEFLKYDPDIQVVLVEGHTDSIAFRRYNKALGHRRANSVKAYLVNKGVNPGKIVTRSHGERRPLESNHTPEGRALNRRVFITLSKTES